MFVSLQFKLELKKEDEQKLIKLISKRFPWNAKYETVYRWLAYFIVIYTIMDLKS